MFRSSRSTSTDTLRARPDCVEAGFAGAPVGRLVGDRLDDFAGGLRRRTTSIEVRGSPSPVHVREDPLTKRTLLLEEPICKWSRKELEKHLDLLVSAVVSSPRYVCTKCGRAANSRKNICKGKRMRDI